MRSPNWGNTFVLSSAIITRRTLGGASKIYKDTRWAFLESCVLQFKALSDLEKDNFLEFILATLGQEITIVDHETRSWTGLITSAPKFTETNRNCGWETSFTFEGIRD